MKVGRAHFDQERQRLIAQAAELGVGSAIHFLDDVPESDLPLLYNVADVCVMPSLYEGFGIPVLESQACGKPVVCANAASLPEVAGDAGVLFEHGLDAADALAAAVVRLLAERDLYRTLRASGLARAATFGWPQTARHTLSVYQRAASR